MFDKIEKKVYEIRQEPEHIRIRYAWGGVVIAMFVVIFIWLISIRINFLKFNTEKPTGNTMNSLQNSLEFQEIEQPTSIDSLLNSETVISETEEEI